MIQIRLPRERWEYDPHSLLGTPGGFGTVFAGRGERHGPVAVKRLHLDVGDAAHRELQIADELIGRSLEHVLPVLDAGQDADSGFYFVVMPRAEKSLQQENDLVAKFADQEAVRILRNIAAGLAEVGGIIVHRDLKPANVLYHEGRWKVADFGIARFVEKSTSLRTLRECLSPPYAAPEQWRLERATPATDVYALGCIAYTLLAGRPPFNGPRIEDYRNQHLHANPPPLDGRPPRLRTLVAMMLRKAPQARPGIDQVITVLGAIAAKGTSGGHGGGLNALAQAGAADAEAIVRAEATRNEQETRQRARRELADSAFQVLQSVVETLSERIKNVAPTAERIPRLDRLQIQFGSARLEIDVPEPGAMISEDAFPQSGWDVVLRAIIRVIQSKPTPYEWSANLWYTNLGRSDEYRWWEVSYKRRWSKRPAKYEPFALTDLSDADRAAAPMVRVFELASEPRPVDDENLDDFCERWAELLAKAYRGQLRKPRYS